MPQVRRDALAPRRPRLVGRRVVAVDEVGLLEAEVGERRRDAALARAQLDEAMPRPRRRHVPDLVRRRGRARRAERLDVARRELTRHLRRARTGRRYSRRDSNPQSSP